MNSRGTKVKARLICMRCRTDVGMCVPVRVGAPPQVWCDHASHGSVGKDASGDIVCPECAYPWHLSGEALVGAIEDALLRHTDHWARVGTVELKCG